MTFDGLTTVAAPSGASTGDIISSLVNIAPTAAKQIAPAVCSLIKVTGDPVKDAKAAAEFIRDNIQYQADGYEFQDIQLPGRMILDTKKADCKSFSLAVSSMLSALGHRNGFRFASYRKNKVPTHVYNFVIGKNGKKYTFDSCIYDLKESPKKTFIQDMEVRYLSEPCNCSPAIGKKGGGKKILLAPVRGAFLSLVDLNVRGLATKLAQAIAKDKATTEAMWKKLGGSFDKLVKNVEKGKKKKALFGKGKGVTGIPYEDEEEFSDYIGVIDVAAVTAFLATAAPALIAAKNLFKKNGIPEGEGDVITPGEADGAEKLPEGFEAADPEKGSGTSFKPSPLLIGGLAAGVLGIYFLTKKGKR